ncbi:hypothetical protein FQR65_LT20553 [Abscondita terminalis]|nr:hypothetical protein FQR65_LT20553 [Abscondita terminalis]
MTAQVQPAGPGPGLAGLAPAFPRPAPARGLLPSQARARSWGARMSMPAAEAVVVDASSAPVAVTRMAADSGTGASALRGVTGQVIARSRRQTTSRVVVVLRALQHEVHAGPAAASNGRMTGGCAARGYMRYCRPFDGAELVVRAEMSPQLDWAGAAFRAASALSPDDGRDMGHMSGPVCVMRKLLIPWHGVADKGTIGSAWRNRAKAGAGE